MQVERVLEYREGFVGPPVPRTQTGRGCPDMQNVCLTPDGSALRPFPGFRRTYPYKLSTQTAAGKRLGGTAEDDDSHGTAAWSNPGNVLLDDDSYAGASGTAVTTHYLRVTGFGFEVPTQATVHGISVILEMWVDNQLGFQDETVQLLKAGVAAGENKGTGLFSIPRKRTGIYGGADDLWDTSWTAEDISHADFGVQYAATIGSGNVKLYRVRMSVWWSGGYQLRVVSFPAEAFQTSGGRGLAVVDEVTGRVVALNYHPTGLTVDAVDEAQRAPVTLGWLNRQGPHDPVLLVPFGNLTHIVTPYDEQHVFDGAEMRLAGVRGPQIAPVAHLEVPPDPDEPLPTGLNGVDGTILDWSSAHPSWDGEESHNPYFADYYTGTTNDWTRDPSRAAGTVWFADWPESSPSRIRVVVKRASRHRGPLCHRNLALGDLALPSNTSSLFLRMNCTVSSQRGRLGAGTLGLVLASETVGVGESIMDKAHVVVTIPPRLYRNRAVDVEVPWAHGAMTVRAIGWTLLNTIPEDAFWSGYEGETAVENVIDFDFYVRYRTAAEVTEEPSVPMGEGEEYRVAFSWVDSRRGRESNLSPYSEVFKLAAGVGLKIDLSGWWEDLEEPLDHPQGMLGLQNSNPEPTQVDRVKVYLHRLAWGLDADGNPQFHKVLEAAIPEPDEKGRLWVQVAAERDEEEMLLEEGPKYNLYVPPAVSAAVVDGERLVLANQQSYSVGRIAVSPGGHIARRIQAWVNDEDDTEVLYQASSPGEGWSMDARNTAVWGPWLEGRQIRIGRTGETFFIVKAMAGADGVYDRLAFYRGNLEGWAGTDYVTAGEYEILPRPCDVFYTHKSAERGTYQEAVSLPVGKTLEMPGDEILALGHVGDFCLALGRRLPVLMLQDSQALDDLVSTGQPYPLPRPLFGSPGCVSGRTLVQLPNRTAMYFTPEGKLALATPSGVEVLPISERFTGYLSSTVRVDQNALRYAHAFYDARRNWYCLCLCSPDEEVAFGVWDDTAPTDPHVDWSEP